MVERLAYLSAESPAPGTAARRDSLFAQVAERLAADIISGTIPPGALIPNEGQLIAGSPVSRSVYREALKFLTAKGLIEAKPRSGTRVAPARAWHLLDPDVLRWSTSIGGDEKFIRDLYELRSFIEPNAARLAADRRDAGQLAALREAYRGMASTTPYSKENVRFDLNFHDVLFEACGNSAVLCLKGVVITTLSWSLQLLAGKTSPDYSEALADHRRVLEAIELCDGERAQAMMTVLIRESLHDTIAMYRARQFARVAAQ